MLRPGYQYDIGVYLQWMRSIDRDGLLYGYSDHTILYPPMYPVILWLLSFVFHFFRIPMHELSVVSTFLLKVPSVLFDIGIVAVVFRLVRSQKKEAAIAWTAGLLYWLNPAVIYDGSAWGQIDSMPIFFAVFVIASYVWKLPIASGAMLALGIFSKPTVIMLIPLVSLLWMRISLRSLATFVVSALVTFVVIHIPFFLSGQWPRIFEVYMGSVGFVTSLSHNAWNLWWPISRVVHIPDTAVFFTFHGVTMTYRQTGMMLLAMSQVVLLYAMWRRKLTLSGISAAFAFVWFSFFMLPTEMHERYAFPAVVFFAMLASLEPQTKPYYIIYTVLFFINLLYIYPLHSIIGRGLSITTVLYTEWFGIYVACAFIMLYIQFFRYFLRRT